MWVIHNNFNIDTLTINDKLISICKIDTDIITDENFISNMTI